jgi:TolA-binding protein
MLYSRGMHGELEKESKEILARIDSGFYGYEATSGRYASFYLGQMYQVRKNYPEAKKYYKECMRFSELNQSTEAGYYNYALIALGEIADREGNKAEARRYFTEVKKRTGRKDEANKDAKRRLKNMEKGD